MTGGSDARRWSPQSEADGCVINPATPAPRIMDPQIRATGGLSKVFR